MAGEPEKGLVFTGARARFSVNGKKVGWATNVSGSEEIQYEEAEVLDNIQVQEHVPVRYRCTLSCSTIRIVGKTLKSQGFFPKIGANSEDLLRNILTNGDLSAMIEDTNAGVTTIIANYEQVKVASHNWTINATGIVGEDVTFVAIRVKDESEV
jgi:hypothetical protein